MPRLFTSHRQPPHAPSSSLHNQRQSSRARFPTERAALQAPNAAIAMPSPSPPPQPTMALIPRQQNLAATSEQNDETPLVLVPPVPKTLLRLMDSHDLDNPYLIAAFNVLIDNNNNPMRVPDILQAVQGKGWTQVLHKHKDRPEQLFGNALRSHQRRRENLNLPSLVFMIDAGACWKHHEIDLSGASGRKKGKIWCFSQDAGFSCPYARLGMDLDLIRRAQGPGGGRGRAASTKGVHPRDEDDADEEDGGDDTSNNNNSSSTADGAPRKKRKVVPFLPPATMATTAILDVSTTERFDNPNSAVRGNVTSVHTVASSLEPPPYIPAAPILLPPHNQHPKSRIVSGTARSTRSTATRGQEATVSRTRGQLGRASSCLPTEVDLDGLEGLEAMSPEPGQEEEGDGDRLDGGSEYTMEEASLLFSEYVSGIPAQPFLPPSVESTAAVPSRSMSIAFESACVFESDDDEDDFHVTMQEFSDDEDMSPLQLNREDSTPAYTHSGASPIDDFESSDGGASIARTPTPGLPSMEESAVTCGLVDHTWEMFDSFPGDGPFHSYNLGIGELQSWDSEHIVTMKHGRPNQGWSRAASPEFSERVHRLMGPSPLDVMEMEGSTAAHTPSCRVDSSETNTQEGSASARSSLSSASSSSSAGSLSLLIPPSTPLSELFDPISSRSRSRRNSISSTLSTSSLHPLILYSPCLSPAADVERPLKCGLAHRYIFPSEDTAEEEGISIKESQQVQELERLLDFGEENDGGVRSPGSPLVSTHVVPPSPFKPMPTLTEAYLHDMLTRSPSPMVFY